MADTDPTNDELTTSVPTPSPSSTPTSPLDSLTQPGVSASIPTQSSTPPDSLIPDDVSSPSPELNSPAALDAQPLTPTPSFTPPTPPVTPASNSAITPDSTMTAAPSPVQPTPEAAVTSPTAPTPQSAAPANLTEGIGSGKYKVIILPEKCIGAASCVAVAPKAFRLNEQQIAEVLPTISQESDDNLLLAAQSCPTMAIEVIDTETGQKIWPK
jgi:ferredoxin